MLFSSAIQVILTLIIKVILRHKLKNPVNNLAIGISILFNHLNYPYNDSELGNLTLLSGVIVYYFAWWILLELNIR